MQKVLVIGGKGMLGNAVVKYFNNRNNYTLETIDARWGEKDFEKIIKENDADFIVNCIGIIPQKKPSEDQYRKVNVDLPVFLESLGKKIIHPSTDCEFFGTEDVNHKYKKDSSRDANDEYGKSKAEVSKLIEETFMNTKIIRTSIIGHELHTNLSLLDWFLNSQGQVRGYTNHYWNGVTTLQWAKVCEELIGNWDNYPVLNQYGTEPIMSKYDVLLLAKEVYNKNISIEPFDAPLTVNKCLASDVALPDLKTQLKELRKLYYTPEETF